MRVIKFRAWDGEKMVQVNDMVLSGEKPKAFWKENGCYESSEIVMQFTGLKDKNGVEIYEGDILKRSKEKNQSFVSVIEYRNGQFGGATYPYRNYWIYISKLSTCDYDGGGYDEIIGNIYENKELLIQGA